MDTAAISLNQLESQLWESANILRSPVDAASFKSYVFPHLFFERISDAIRGVSGRAQETRMKAMSNTSDYSYTIFSAGNSEVKSEAARLATTIEEKLPSYRKTLPAPLQVSGVVTNCDRSRDPCQRPSEKAVG